MSIATGQVATAADVLAAIAAKAMISSGSYTGDDNVNRAITHSLGVTPKFVFIVDADINHFHVIIAGLAAVCYMRATATAVQGTRAVTAATATYFYVGTTGELSQSANYNGRVYYWVAIG